MLNADTGMSSVSSPSNGELQSNSPNTDSSLLNPSPDEISLTRECSYKSMCGERTVINSQDDVISIDKPLSHHHLGNQTFETRGIDLENGNKIDFFSQQDDDAKIETTATTNSQEFDCEISQTQANILSHSSDESKLSDASESQQKGRNISEISSGSECIVISTQCLALSQSEHRGLEEHHFKTHLRQNFNTEIFENGLVNYAKEASRCHSPPPNIAKQHYRSARPSLLDFMQVESELASGVSSPKLPIRATQSPTYRARCSLQGKDSSPTTITPKKLDIADSPDSSRKPKVGKNDQRRRESAQCNAWLSSLQSSGGRLNQNRLEQLEEDGPLLELADAAKGVDPARRRSSRPLRAGVIPPREGTMNKSAAAAAAAVFLKKSDTPTRMRLPSPRICPEKLWLPAPVPRPVDCPPDATAQQQANMADTAEELAVSGGDGGVQLSTGRVVALETTAEGLMDQLRSLRLLRDDCILSVADFEKLQAAIVAAVSALSASVPFDPAGPSPATAARGARPNGESTPRLSDAIPHAHGRPPSRASAGPPTGESAAAPASARRPSSSGAPRVPARPSTGSAALPSTPVIPPPPL